MGFALNDSASASLIFAFASHPLACVLALSELAFAPLCSCFAPLRFDFWQPCLVESDGGVSYSGRVEVVVSADQAAIKVIGVVAVAEELAVEVIGMVDVAEETAVKVVGVVPMAKEVAVDESI